MSEKLLDSLKDSLDTEGAMTFGDFAQVVDRWLLLPDKNVLKILMAGVISHYFTSDPLWIFFVAPSSGSKTEIVSMITELEKVYMLSDLTDKTLASGMGGKGDNDPSLLEKLHDNIVVMKDFTTVLSMRSEQRQVILSQLREVYDGRYIKDFGNGKHCDWSGRWTMIAGVTPIIDTHSSVFQLMGERFIIYRIPQARDEDVANRALSLSGQEKQMRDELREAARQFFSGIVIPEKVVIPDEIRIAMSALSSFIVRARSGVVRDPYSKDLIYIPETEAPARLAKQLGVLIRALAVLGRRQTCSWSDYYLTLKCALDVIPANRMRHITALCGRESPQTTTEIAQYTEYSRAGAELILEDLAALRVIEVNRQGSGQANEWRMSPRSYDYFSRILPTTNDSLWEIFNESHPHRPLVWDIVHGKLAVFDETAIEEVDWLADAPSI